MDSDQAIAELTGETMGIYRVSTRSGSRYLVEIAGSGLVQIRRTPAAFTLSGDWSASLYSDGEALTCRLSQMKVGLPGAFTFVKRERALKDPEYSETTRFTTIIESIEPVTCS